MVHDPYEVVEGIRLADMTPLPHHLLIRWNHKEETKGGVLYTHDRQRLNYMRGVVLRQGFCDGRWFEGETVLFDGLCDKSFLGPQVPGERDTVFFMREEDLFAIILTKESGGSGGLKMVNRRLMIKPDLVNDHGGIALVNTEQKKDGIWGSVVYADPQSDVREGEHVIYDKTQKTDVKLGDFDGELHHCVPDKAVEAVALDSIGVVYAR